MIDALIDKIIERKNPTVVGLDPRLDYIPAHIKKACFEEFGRTPKGAAESFLQFSKIIIDSVYDIVPAVKPQVAMFEQFGYEGLRAYIEVIEYAKFKNLIVIGDIKRSDIASTAEAYSNGHIGRVDVEGELFQVYQEDFITLNPYLGIDSIEPYKKDCKVYDKGLFILVKTSNPNSGQLQNLITDGEMLYERVGKLVSQWGEDLIGKYGYSLLGAVVGATHPEEGKRLRQLMPHTFFLVPGYGAQGATADDLKGVFDERGLGAIINSSRGIIAAYKNEKYKKDYEEKEFGQAARKAALDMKADLQGVIN
ncbi:orotidine-5'-phosphate decarboxylase [Tissierella creatinini]|nr:orotidine-5'-phosphate decarboxylase [Tissierella creatinini]TJX66127.1 orotidine-5'-phosphate decarboxylase [Soehngenia saccharolytica]